MASNVDPPVEWLDQHADTGQPEADQQARVRWTPHGGTA